MEKWHKEVESSLEEAIEKAGNADIPLTNLFMLAPILYSQKHHMNNDALIRKMFRETEAQVEEDCSHDEKSRFQYKFHYVSSYLYCFVVAGKLEEMKYDRIMEYVSSKMDLFTDDYGIE